MELENIGTILNIVFLAFVVIGFLVGLIRGLKKTIIRMVWILVIGIVLMFVTTPIALSIVRADISKIPGISEVLGEATSIESYIAMAVANSTEAVDPETVARLISIISSLAAMFLSGILFLLFFIALKYATIPLYAILNIFIGRTKGNKRRLLGGVVGMLLGVVIFTFITTPFIGYLNIVNKIDEIPIAGLTPTPYTVSEEDNTNKSGLISSTPAGEIIDAIENSTVLKVYSAIGLNKVQLFIFNETSAVKIEGETVKLNDELDSISNIIVKVMPFTDGTIDLSNFEELSKDPEQLEIISTNISGLVGALYESKIFKGTMSALMPMVTEFIQEEVSVAIQENPDIDPELADAMVGIISDFCENIVTSDSEKITMALSSIFDVLTVFPKLGQEDGFASLTVTDFEKIGNILDSFIICGLVKEENINAFVPAVIDVVLDASSEEEGMPEELVTLLTDVKDAFKDGNIVYKNEFKAVGELVIGLGNITTDDSEEFNPEQLKQVGDVLDKALSHGSVIFNRKVFDDLVVNLFDVLISSGDSEEAELNEILEMIKQPFKDHEITSYGTEFDALAKALECLSKLDTEANVEFSEVGKTLDEVIATKSKIIDHDFINYIIKYFVDEIATGLDSSLKPTVTEIKNGFTGNDISYQTELTAIELLLNAFDDVDSNVNLPEFGKTLDDIIALNSKTINKKLINNFIADSYSDFVSQTQINKAGCLADALSNIKIRLKDNNYTIRSYKTELVAIDKIIEISNVAGKLSINDIDKKLFDGNTKTIGQVFDDNIKDSVLIGDCGVDVISCVITEFDKANNGKLGKRDYTKITAKISNNLEKIKPNVKCGSNKNLGSTNTISYTDLSNAFEEIHHYLDDETFKVTDKEEFTGDIATYYEESLNKLQNNILLDVNGTRAVASYICDEIIVILEEKASSVSLTSVADVIRMYKGVIANYKAYLDRPENIANGKINEKEPYTSTASTEYVTSTDGFKTNVTFTNVKPSENFAYRTKPFTSIANEIGQYLK